MVVGLTGKICSGKNYIGNLLAKRGFEVWDLDIAASKIRNRKKAELRELFGTSDTKEISDIVFNDSSKLKALENLIYPELKEKIKAFPFDLVINGALLNRAGFDGLCTFIIYVNAPDSERRKRAEERGFSAGEFERRNEKQKDVVPSAYSCPVVVLENFNKTEEELIADLDRILSDPPVS